MKAGLQRPTSLRFAFGRVAPRKSQQRRALPHIVHRNARKEESTLTIPLETEGFMNPPRLMLADDHALLLEAFRKMLEPRYDVVGTVADGSIRAMK